MRPCDEPSRAGRRASGSPYTVTVKATPAAPRRHVVIVVADILASVIFLVFGAVLALTVVGYAAQFGTVTADCGAGPFDGLECSSIALSIAVYGLIGVTVLGYFLAVGMVIVSVIRKRLTFWWPLGAVILIIVAFYAAAWVAGMVAPAGVSS
ncbi:DUF6264 family protein [Salinibacterium sp.]|uniref:DUF6264 family protein n=1 Tax=Salinibacterium sp. TaxID=1915057 RepID=UPI00286B67A2|nr:DUF6264 family protein [Salinibacterium sp.]